MRIAIVGAGGVGGYFGGQLAAAGEAVWFVARGAHLAALQRDGLTVLSEVGPIERLAVRATARADEVGPVDLVMLAVKLWDTDAALQQIASLVGSGTALVSFQNGVEAVDWLSAAYGRARVLGGVCHIPAAIERPGVIRHLGRMARLTVGELDGSTTPRLTAFADACRRARIDIAIAPDIVARIWDKFVFLSTFSGLTALTRLPIGPLRADPDTRRVLRRGLEEATAVALKRGIDLGAEPVERLLRFADGLPDAMKASMVHDLERGARLEVPWLSGAVVRLGDALGVPTPAHETMLAGLKHLAHGNSPT